jgi:hypothetical protein
VAAEGVRDEKIFYFGGYRCFEELQAYDEMEEQKMNIIQY